MTARFMSSLLASLWALRAILRARRLRPLPDFRF